MSLLKSSFESLCLSLVSRLAEEGEHVLLVCLHTRLVERIHAKDVSADSACLLEEVEEGSEVMLVDALDRGLRGYARRCTR